MNWKKVGNDIMIECDHFSPAATLDCGQAFRWSAEPDGTISGIAFGKYLRLREENGCVLLNTTEEDFLNIWRSYFDLERDYSSILSAVSGNPIIKQAAEKTGGIRVLRQDPWETLCSFIISQNNNIPRIKGIISRFCEAFGAQIPGGFAFPRPEDIAPLSAEDLAPLRCGFRARYLLDAARRVAGGQTDLEAIRRMPTDPARAELMKICGVGEKVADCTLLFGLSHIDALPKDVWIKRVLAEWFGGSLPEAALPYAGIIQQYLFQYARTGGLQTNADRP